MSAPRPSIHVDRRADAPNHGYIKPRRVILHCTQSPNHPGTRDISGVFDFWMRQGRGYWIHAIIDGDGNSGWGQDFNKMVWATGGANSGSLQIELIGYASYSRKDWLKKHPNQLQTLARWLAIWHEKYGIPLVHDSERGVSQHRDHPIGGHTDINADFPLDWVLRRAKQLARL